MFWGGFFFGKNITVVGNEAYNGHPDQANIHNEYCKEYKETQQ